MILTSGGWKSVEGEADSWLPNIIASAHHFVGARVSGGMRVELVLLDDDAHEVGTIDLGPSVSLVDGAQPLSLLANRSGRIFWSTATGNAGEFNPDTRQIDSLHVCPSHPASLPQLVVSESQEGFIVSCPSAAILLKVSRSP